MARKQQQEQQQEETTDRVAGQSVEEGEAEAKGDVQAQVDAEQERGYFGTKVDPRPNSDYSLESGPDAPSAVEDDRSRIAQHVVGEEENR